MMYLSELAFYSRELINQDDFCITISFVAHPCGVVCTQVSWSGDSRTCHTTSQARGSLPGIDLFQVGGGAVVMDPRSFSGTLISCIDSIKVMVLSPVQHSRYWIHLSQTTCWIVSRLLGFGWVILYIFLFLFYF